MKTLQSIQEGFYKNTNSGAEVIKSKINKVMDVLKVGYPKLEYTINDDFSVSIKGDIILRKNNDITELGITIKEFIRGKDTTIQISECPNLKSLKGLPVDGEIYEYYVVGCPQLTSIEDLGLSQKVVYESIEIDGCVYLKDLKGFPTKVQRVYLTLLDSIKDLSGLEKLSMDAGINIDICNKLESLKGLPKKMDWVYISDCDKLKSLDYLPKADEYNIHDNKLVDNIIKSYI